MKDSFTYIKKLTAVILITAFCLALASCGEKKIYGTIGKEAIAQPEDTATSETHATNPYGADMPTIDVSLEPVNGLKITGENPIKIRSGEDAVFDVTVEKGYTFKNTDEMTLENGKLTVRSIKYPSTITPIVNRVDPYKISMLSNDKSLGDVTFSTEDSGGENVKTIVKATAKSSDDSVFLGFSEGRTVSEGGTLISTDKELNMSVEKDTVLYANFNSLSPKDVDVSAHEWRVIYHANGGKAFGTLDSFYTDFVDGYYYFPNAMPDMGYLTRDGYVLAGYKDAKGNFVGCGWNIETENSVSELYAYWLPETKAEDFTFIYDAESAGMKVLDYSGNDETVVIPENFSDRPVTAIAAGAFENSTMKQLMITKNITVINDKAISGCKQLETLVFSDGVMEVSDDMINDCPSLSKLIMHAVMMPRFSDDREGTYVIKYEHVKSSRDKKKMMIVAGSNTAYGLDSTMLYDKLNPEYGYDIINTGCNSYSPALYFLEVCKPFAKEGDVLLFCPEDTEYQFGKNEIVVYIWHFFEGAYESFYDIDMRAFTGTFTSFAKFNKTRANMAPKAYTEKTKETTNRFGDYCAEKVGHTKSFDPFNVTSKTIFHSANVTKYADLMNASIDDYASKGVDIWMSYTVINKNRLEDTSLPGTETYNTFIKTVKDTIHATVISDQADYIMDPEYFYNTNQHLNTAGTKIRSEKLLEDILKALEK